MNPLLIPPVPRRPWRAALAGVGLLVPMFAACPLAAAPPTAERLESEKAVVARADRYANTEKGIAYRDACAPMLAQAAQKALRGLKGNPKRKFLCDFVVVIGADGRVKQAIVADDGFSARVTDELRKLTLPAPPRDDWPLGIHWELAMRKK